MSTPARRRLMRDFKRLQDDPPVGVSGAPTDNNILLWNAVIFGCVFKILFFCLVKNNVRLILNNFKFEFFF